MFKKFLEDFDKAYFALSPKDRFGVNMVAFGTGAIAMAYVSYCRRESRKKKAQTANQPKHLDALWNEIVKAHNKRTTDRLAEAFKIDPEEAMSILRPHLEDPNFIWEI